MGSQVKAWVLPASSSPPVLLFLPLSDADRVIALLLSSRCLLRPLLPSLLRLAPTNNFRSVQFLRCCRRVLTLIIWLVWHSLRLHFVPCSHSLGAGAPAFPINVLGCDCGEPIPHVEASLLITVLALNDFRQESNTTGLLLCLIRGYSKWSVGAFTGETWYVCSPA